LLPSVRLKIRAVLLPLTVTFPAPGPTKVSVLAKAISPLVSVIVPEVAAPVKLIVPPSAVEAIASRKDPAPESSRLVTSTAAAGAASPATNAANVSVRNEAHAR
jgi:hypothetical protein